MKANIFNRMLIAVFLLSCISIYSCKKDASSTNGGDTTTTDITATGDDEEQISNEADNISNDANTVLSASTEFSGSSSTSLESGNTGVNSTGELTSQPNIHQYICDAVVSYDTIDNNRTITITYDGTGCWGNRKREGVVTISLPVGQHWKSAGAVATVTATDLKITRLRDGKSIVLNGTKTITNVSGGLLKDLSSLHTITHAIVGSLKINFSNSTSRTWNVSKQRVFTYDNGIVITTTGTYNDGTDGNIAEWGMNRFGNNFKTLISAPIVIRQDCDFRLVSGQHTLITDNATAVITYGLDANGDATTCPAGDYYFKLVWTGKNGKSYTIIWPY